MTKPTIFISAVSSEFGSIRRLVAESLTQLGYEPITQEIFGTEPGDLTEVLRRKIDQCEGVVHIAGVAYGAEPPVPDAQFGRVSYTQFEVSRGFTTGESAWPARSQRCCRVIRRPGEHVLHDLAGNLVAW